MKLLIRFARSMYSSLNKNFLSVLDDTSSKILKNMISNRYKDGTIVDIENRYYQLYFDCLSEDISRLTHTNFCLVTSSQNLQEVALGMKRFNENVRHLGSVDFSALQARLAGY